MATVASTTVLTTPGDLTATMQIYYDKVFLDRAMQEMSYSYLAIKKTVPKNSGKTVYFTRYTPLAVVSTAATEGVTPTGVNSTAATVSASLGIYTNFERVSTFFELTSIDAGLKELIEVHGQNAGESMDTVLGNVMSAGATGITANSVAQITAMRATDTLTVAEIRSILKTLKVNKAPKFENGKYRAVVSSQGIYELQGDTAAGNWINIGLYNSAENAKMLKDGVIGSLYGFDIKESNNQITQSVGLTASPLTGYFSFFGGKGAVAEVDIAGSGNARTIIKRSGASDTSNPVDMFMTVGWKVDAYAGAVLNANWIVKFLHC